MAWELFKQEKGRRSFPIPTLTMFGNRQIRLNVSAVDKFDLRKFKFANLYFDKDTQRIGIELLKKPLEGAVSLSKEKKSRGIIISAFNFMRYYKIDFEGGREVKKEENLLVIKL